MTYPIRFSKTYGIALPYGAYPFGVNAPAAWFRRVFVEFFAKTSLGAFFIPFLLSVVLLHAPLQSSAKAADELVILALGDSLTAGYGLDAGDAFPNRLEQALRQEGHAVRVINAGVSGDTTGGGLSRVDWLMAEKPDLILLELGANDGLRALDPKDTHKNLSAIIEKAQAAGAHVLLAGMLAPPNLGKDYGAAFNAVFPALAESYDVTFYPFFLEGVATEPELTIGDGMHPNPEGVSMIVKNILPTVKEAIARARDGE